MPPNEDERPTGPESISPSDESPPTQTEGALVPPPRKPPTAVDAAADPLFPPNPRRRVEGWRRRVGPGSGISFAQFATEFLDAVDAVADRIAETLRLRQ
jgi:hypothetical protein